MGRLLFKLPIGRSTHPFMPLVLGNCSARQVDHIKGRSGAASGRHQGSTGMPPGGV
jgi:hypothetical protein